LEKADVATTVNRGFARGMRTEPLQRFVMARHLQPLLDKVVGINNAAFRPLDQELIELRDLLDRDFLAGRDRLYQLKETHRQRLPDRIARLADGKILVVGMGRRVMQKLHDVLVASLHEILQQDPRFPILAIFATVHGDANSPAVLERIRDLESEFPSNVVCEDGRIDYYPQLMAAADYNCMPSLYEPHGGAYEGTALPIARAVDGLAEQIRGRSPSSAVRAVSDAWHAENDPPTGLLYREELEAEFESSELRVQLEAILQGRPFQPAFDLMRDALTPVLREAIDLRLRQPDQYARMVQAALHKQEVSSWHDNLRQMLELVEKARTARSLT
jgi:glycogen synthase